MDPRRDEWKRFQRFFLHDRHTAFSLDLSRMGMDDPLAGLEAQLSSALEDMRALEAGSIANPDEGRQVGHYWLRAPELAPTEELGSEIEKTLESVIAFADSVRGGELEVAGGGAVTQVLCIGIGGSALGPQLVDHALSEPESSLPVHFLDNTDPDGVDRLLATLGDGLRSTLIVVISKSGGTAETRNGMLEVRSALSARGLKLAERAVAITGSGSALDRLAKDEGWLARFPMWDWVGGRTSLMSAVGLLPAALAGISVRELLLGAALMDRSTRAPAARNLAAWMAAAWHHATGGKGEKDLVVLPYKDRLELFSRYLQQLIMESLGKELDLEGRVVEQGISVYGNKGSTDQHAFVQQLRDGVANFFVSFIEVARSRRGARVEVEPGVDSGDYLQGFLRGTREALSEKGRPNLCLSIPELSARSLGSLIALFERTVGIYASLIGVNAYHQPGVEAGKKAAAKILKLQEDVLGVLARDNAPSEVGEIAEAAGAASVEAVFHVLRHLAANRPEIRKEGGESLLEARWSWIEP